MSIDLPPLPAEVSVRVGETARVPLPSFAGGGYEWSAVAVAGAEVASVGIGVEALPAPVSPPPPGTRPPPSTTLAGQWAEVLGLATGEARWRLVLARRFAPGAPAAQHHVRVVVSP